MIIIIIIIIIIMIHLPEEVKSSKGQDNHQLKQKDARSSIIEMTIGGGQVGVGQERGEHDAHDEEDEQQQQGQELEDDRVGHPYRVEHPAGVQDGSGGFG